MSKQHHIGLKAIFAFAPSTSTKCVLAPIISIVIQQVSSFIGVRPAPVALLRAGRHMRECSTGALLSFAFASHMDMN